MGLYLCGNKVKLNLNGSNHCLNLISEEPTLKSNLLLSSEGYALKDSKGLYLITKEDK